MKIVLSGVETKNKGAELMLYAILQEIERKYPDAVVYIERRKIPQGLGYLKTKLDVRYWPIESILTKLHLSKFIRALHLPFKYDISSYAVRGANYFLDGSGFTFSDQWGWNNRGVKRWNRLLKRLHEKGSKIVFLPQAMGPAEKDTTKKMFSVLSQYSTIIMPREKVSYNYLKNSGVVDMSKVKMYTDFTSLVEGTFPNKYKHLEGGICIIPNMRMIDKGIISFADYIKLLLSFIAIGKKTNNIVYLLNHEGKDDELLAFKCKKEAGNDIEVVTGLNALEVKGLISTAKLVITSRFHGLASALNSCVPCLSTSWSHKYEELYKDYNLTDCILPLSDNKKTIQIVSSYLNEDKNNEIRQHLKERLPYIQAKTKEMWNVVWKS